MFRIIRVRVRWVGTNPGPASNAEIRIADPTPPTVRAATSQPSASPRWTWVFQLRNMRVRLSWLGLRISTRARTWLWGLCAVVLAILAITRVVALDLFRTDFSADGRSAAVQTARTSPIVEEFDLNGETIRVTHTPFDIGEVKDLFDRDTSTLARGLKANPLLLDFEFPQAKPLKGLAMDFGRMDFLLRIQLYAPESGQPTSYQGEYRGQPPEPHVEMRFEKGPALVKRVRIEIEQLAPPDEPHIHVREVRFD